MLTALQFSEWLNRCFKEGGATNQQRINGCIPRAVTSIVDSFIRCLSY